MEFFFSVCMVFCILLFMHSLHAGKANTDPQTVVLYPRFKDWSLLALIPIIAGRLPLLVCDDGPFLLLASLVNQQQMMRPFCLLCLRLFLWKACSQEIFLGSGHQCNDIFFYRGVKNCQPIIQSLPDFRSFQLVFGEWASTYNCFPDCDVFRTFHGHQDIKLCSPSIWLMHGYIRDH